MKLTISQGTLRGTTGTNLNGDTIYCFHGIPYGTSPVGKLRFKAPIPAKNWSGTLDATKDKDPCYQRDCFKRQIYGSEDCLHLNVFTKKFDCLRPVIFWIPGGGLIFGSNHTDYFGPDFLLTEDVVLVTINYRVGIFAFISFKDPSLEVPGNAGFKDMVLALQWVQNNIAHFGGDPNNVTIAGASLGACAAHLLTLSPKTENLFHKAILQSGTCLNIFLHGTGGTKEISNVLKLNNEQQVYDYLMEASVEKLLEIQESIFQFKDFKTTTPTVFSFVVEPYENEDTFLSKSPFEILTSSTCKQVPIILGYCSDELLLHAVGNKKFDFKREIPWFLNLPKSSTNDFVDKVTKYYFGDCKNSDITIKQLTDYYSDSFYYFGIYLFVFYLNKFWTEPVYFYRFELDSKLNWMKRLNKLRPKGTIHYDDLGYLFKNFASPKITVGSTEDFYIRRLVRLWTNFVKFGDPSPKYDPLLNVKWESTTGNNWRYLQIGHHLKMSTDRSDLDRSLFLKKLYKGYGTSTSLWKAHL